MKKVLLIEDDEVVRENTAELLELANYKVFTAANGKIGVAEAKKQLPDIILCDIMMPELNGYGVLQILSKEYDTKHIPFIFLSAKVASSFEGNSLVKTIFQGLYLAVNPFSKLL